MTPMMQTVTSPINLLTFWCAYFSILDKVATKFATKFAKGD